MKPIPYTIATAFVLILALAIGWMMASHYQRCPEPIAPDPSLQLRFDSVAQVNASLQAQLDSLSTLPPVTQRIREALHISRSLSLDSLGSDLFADPN